MTWASVFWVRKQNEILLGLELVHDEVWDAAHTEGWGTEEHKSSRSGVVPILYQRLRSATDLLFELDHESLKSCM